LADYVILAAAVLVFLGVGFGILRLVLGPTVIDRVAAVDILTIVCISTMSLYALMADRFIYLDAALVYAVLSFLAIVAVARYLERGL